jgi:hypothetical protein
VVANELLSAGLSSVITDDKLSPTMALQLAQAMRDIKTGSIPSFLIEGTPEQIGDQSVLIPRIQNETMRQVLALFQGAASFAEPIAEPAEGGGGAGAAVAPSSGATTTTVPPTTVPATTTTAVPVVSPQQLTLGVAPPNDPTCH